MEILEQPEEGAGTVFRDMIFLALCGFVSVVVLMLAHINPKGKQEADTSVPPGSVIVEITWPNDLNTDVDLWVQAPGDLPVGYSNKGEIFNLLRDDLGRHQDLLELNYETSYSRGIPAGEYIVNLHLYRNPSGVYPIPVAVAVSVKSDPAASARQILFSKVALKREGEELTVFRFSLDKRGNLVPGSVHNIQRPLRAFRSSP